MIPDGLRPSWRWWQLALLAAIATFDLFLRPELGMLSALGRDPLAEVVVDTGLNWRLMVFVVLPIFLVWVQRDAGWLADPGVFLRAGGYRGWLWLAIGRAASKAIALIACMVAPALAVGLGAAPRGPESGLPQIISGDAQQVALAVAWVATVAVNLTSLGVLTQLARLSLGWVGGLLSTVGIFTVVAAGASAMVPIAPLNIGLGIQPLPATDQYGSPAWALVVPTLINACLIALGALILELRVRRRLDSLAAPATAIAVTAVVTLRLSLGSWNDTTTAFAAGFYGSGGSLFDYVTIVVVMLAPIWLATTRLERAYEELPWALPRAGTAASWFWRSLLPTVIAYPFFLVAILAMGMAVLWLRYHGLSVAESEVPVTPLALSYHFLVNGTLQGWCIVLVVAGMRWASGSPWGGLGALGVIVGVGAVTPRLPWLPLTDLGLGQLIDGRDPLAITAASGCWLLLLLASTVALTTRLSAPLVERNLA